MADSGTGTNPFVSVIVVTHDGADHLPACLDALAALSYPADRRETLLVDNASPAGSLGFLRGQHPDVRVIPSTTNLGFAGGCNLGLREARGDYAVLLNDDTRVDPHWLDALVDAAEADPEAGICTSRIRLADGRLQSTGAIPYVDGSSRDRGENETDSGQYARIEEVFGGCGASMLLRRAMLEEIGLLEDRFFMYYEDTDLSWRARAAGWKVLYVPDSVVVHLHQATMGRGTRDHLFYSDRNRLLLVLRNASLPRVLWVWGRYALGTIPGLSRAPVPTSVRLHALASALGSVPASLAARRRIRARRRVPERDLVHWFQPLP